MVRNLLSIHELRPRPLAWGCGNNLRREFIYPHRAVRALPISRGRIVAALLLAAIFSVLVARYATQLFAIHGHICAFFLNLADRPHPGRGCARFMDPPSLKPRPPCAASKTGTEY